MTEIINSPLTELQLFLQVIQTGGILTVLGFLVWAFYTGAIVSKPVLDKILEQYAKNFAQANEKILDRLDEAIKAAQNSGNKQRDGW